MTSRGPMRHVIEQRRRKIGGVFVILECGHELPWDRSTRRQRHCPECASIQVANQEAQQPLFDPARED